MTRTGNWGGFDSTSFPSAANFAFSLAAASAAASEGLTTSLGVWSHLLRFLPLVVLLFMLSTSCFTSSISGTTLHHVIYPSSYCQVSHVTLWIAMVCKKFHSWPQTLDYKCFMLFRAAIPSLAHMQVGLFLLDFSKCSQAITAGDDVLTYNYSIKEECHQIGQTLRPISSGVNIRYSSATGLRQIVTAFSGVRVIFKRFAILLYWSFMLMASWLPDKC